MKRKVSNHKRVGKRRFTDETFLRAWRQSESMEQLAQRLGVKTEMVKRYAARLRAAGVELPEQEVV